MSVGVPLVWFAWLQDVYVPTILMYHAVDEQSAETKLSVSPEAFERQMQFLKEHGYQVMALSDLAARLRDGRPIPWKTVVITFDDGLASVATTAFPILRRHGFPATVFVIYDRVGRPDFMTWEDLRAWANAGLEVGCHTYSHPILSDAALSEADLRREIVEARRLIGREIRRPVRVFSYPGGFLDDRVKRIVRAAGYEAAVGAGVSESSERCEPFVLRRIKISRTANPLFVFWVKVMGLVPAWKQFIGT